MINNAPFSPWRSREENHALIGLAPLLRSAKWEKDLTPLGQRLLAKATQHDDASAMHDLAIILMLKYQPEAALALQATALTQQTVFRLNERLAPTALRLLVLKAPGDLAANTPIECLIEGRDMQVDLMYIGPKSTRADFPPHDLVFVACCMSEANEPILAKISELLRNHSTPILNHPDYIGCTSRENAYAMLHDVPHIKMAATRLTARAELLDMVQAQRPVDSLFAEGHFPIIVRPRDTHAGIGLARIGNHDELNTYLTNQVSNDYYVAQFIDYQNSDGLYRKYRIVLIQGQPFLCHMGISSHWMVHYPYAEMVAHPERRDTEARAMAHFSQGLGRRHGEAFAAIARRSGLDYIGFDCAETQDGRLLIFEIANGMVIHDMDDAIVFPYKLPQMHRTFDAFCQMLNGTAAASGDALPDAAVAMTSLVHPSSVPLTL